MNRFKKFLKYLLVPFALIGSIISIYSINTYAYETNQFSYSVTYDSNKTDSLNTAFYTLNTPITSQSNITILINFDVSSISSSVSIYSYSFMGDNYTNSNGNSDITLYPQYANNGVFTINFSRNITRIYGFSISAYYNSTWLNVSQYITNIDIILSSDISTTSYISNYVGNLQQQYNTLLSQYNSLNTSYTQLQSDYSTLSTNYTDLQNQYHDLSFDYEVLEDSFDMLQTRFITLTNDYNRLQNNYNSLQSLYNELQTRYNNLLADYNRYVSSVFPFKSDFYTTRTMVLNGVTTDMGVNTPNYNGVVWTQDDKLVISPRDTENYNGYINGTNVGSLTFVSTEAHTFYSYSVVSWFTHGNDNYFNVSFYLDDKLVMTTINFDTDMGDGENTYNLVYPTTFNKFVVSFEWSSSSNYDDSYFYANQSSFANGYQYAYDEMNPIISSLRDDLERSNNIVNDIPNIRQQEYNRGKQDGIVIGSNDNNTLYGMVIRKL